MHSVIESETIKAISLILVIKEVPQSGIVMDILRVKYAQIFQKYIEKCFIRLKGSLCYRRSYTRYLFFLHLNKC